MDHTAEPGGVPSGGAKRCVASFAEGRDAIDAVWAAREAADDHRLQQHLAEWRAAAEARRASGYD